MTATEWISVKDREPDKGAKVLVWSDGKVWVAEYKGNYWFLSVPGIWTAKNTTHWMPLPDPPPTEAP